MHPKQSAALQRALHHRFKAVAFDIDGTLTELSHFIIPSDLAQIIANLPTNLPRALCTGRPLEFISTQLKHICSHAPNPAAEQKRWWIFAENGGIGYHYSPHKKEYTAFYDVPWPQEKINQEALEAFIKDRFGGMVVIRLRPYSMVIRYHDWMYFFPRLTRVISRRVHKRLSHLLQELKLDHDFSVQDSGIGNVIFSKSSGKGHAMEHWAKKLGIPLRDILVIGDQARPGGNDEDFLSGRYGTAFTVGHQTKNLYPLPVLDGKGRKLWGPRGTEVLLKKLFFKVP